VQYRELGRTGLRISALGFGAMRLPQRGDHVDEEAALACIERGLELGINYLDTAPGYHAGESEVVVGKALKGRRDRAYVSTKYAVRDATADSLRRDLDASLRRLDMDYVDVYHLWGINLAAFRQKIDVPGGPLSDMQRAKEEGLIRHLAFSFHDAAENLFTLIDTGHFESITVQYNLLDRANEKAIGYAKEKGLGVVIMGPVGGGRLGGPSPVVQKMIGGGARSTPEVALRFVLAHPGVTCAISGMNTLNMVEENAATASRTEPLSAAERRRVAELLEENKRLADLYCTGCNYCMPCPHGVDIPGNFLAMNYLRVYGLGEYARHEYARLVREHKSAVVCEECGECEPKCPQHIPIVAQLKETAAEFGDS